LRFPGRQGRRLAVVQNLQRVAVREEICAEGSYPQWLPDQIRQDPGRQRPPGLDSLRTALVGEGGYPEHHGGRDCGYHGD
jgi:hypothetical protein